MRSIFKCILVVMCSITDSFLSFTKLFLLNSVFNVSQVHVPLEVVHLTDEYWNNVVNIFRFGFLMQLL